MKDWIFHNIRYLVVGALSKAFNPTVRFLFALFSGRFLVYWSRAVIFHIAPSSFPGVLCAYQYFPLDFSDAKRIMMIVASFWIQTIKTFRIHPRLITKWFERVSKSSPTIAWPWPLTHWLTNSYSWGLTDITDAIQVTTGDIQYMTDISMKYWMLNIYFFRRWQCMHQNKHFKNGECCPTQMPCKV